MRRPSARSRAARAAASSRVMAGASRLPAEAECLPQLRARDRGGTPLHHHDPTRDVRERRGNGGRGAARPGGRENADDGGARPPPPRTEEHTSELHSPCNLVFRLLLLKKKKKQTN